MAAIALAAALGPPAQAATIEPSALAVQAPPAPRVLPAVSTPAPLRGPLPSGGGGCARPDDQLDRQWTARGPGLTGGDAGYSLPLPDGRTLWLFGDSFFGTVAAFGERSGSSEIARNSIVVQDGDELRVLNAGTALTPGAHPGAWYWPLDATVEGDEVRLFMARMLQGAPGADPVYNFWQFGTDVVTLDLDDLTVTDTHTVTADFGISWGNAVLEERDHTYVFGLEEAGPVDFVHVARAPAGDVLGQWEHWDGAGWSLDPAESAQVAQGTSTQFGVVRQGGRYVLVTQLPVQRDVVAASAPSPTGPWGPPTTIYTVPDFGPGSFTYNATPHPQLTRDGELVVGYSINTRDLATLFARPNAYRLRFMRVAPGCLPSP